MQYHDRICAELLSASVLLSNLPIPYVKEDRDKNKGGFYFRIHPTPDVGVPQKIPARQLNYFLLDRSSNLVVVVVVVVVVVIVRKLSEREGEEPPN